MEHGRSRKSSADSVVIGKLVSNWLQYLMHETTSNLSAAIRISSRTVGSVVVSFPLYIKLKSSMRAVSSVTREFKKKVFIRESNKK